MIPSKVKPFMTYLEPDNITRLQKFAKKKKITMSQVIREALNARMSDEGDPYNAGFNAGIEESINIIKKNKASSSLSQSRMSRFAFSTPHQRV